MKIRPVGAEFSIRTDRHEEDNSSFLQFCEDAYELKTITLRERSLALSCACVFK